MSLYVFVPFCIVVWCFAKMETDMGLGAWCCKFGLHAYEPAEHQGSDTAVPDGSRYGDDTELHDSEYADVTYAVVCRRCGQNSLLYRTDPRYMTTYWH